MIACEQIRATATFFGLQGALQTFNFLKSRKCAL